MAAWEVPDSGLPRYSAWRGLAAPVQSMDPESTGAAGEYVCHRRGDSEGVMSSECTGSKKKRYGALWRRD